MMFVLLLLLLCAIGGSAETAADEGPAMAEALESLRFWSSAAASNGGTAAAAPFLRCPSSAALECCGVRVGACDDDAEEAVGDGDLPPSAVSADGRRLTGSRSPLPVHAADEGFAEEAAAAAEEAAMLAVLLCIGV